MSYSLHASTRAIVAVMLACECKVLKLGFSRRNSRDMSLPLATVQTFSKKPSLGTGRSAQLKARTKCARHSASLGPFCLVSWLLGEQGR
jgi:hypothetical protein